jgi:transposase
MTLYVRTFQNQERELLKALQKAPSAPAALVQRAQILLHSAAKQPSDDIACQVGLSVSSIRRWIKRFNSAGLLGLFDRPRSGRPREYTAEQALRVAEVATTAPERLSVPVNTWSLSHLQRYLEEHTAVGRLCRETIRQILQQQGISYQKAQRWQDSPDPQFDEKKEAIIDCYVHPPEDTIVLCFDQKGPVQFKQYGGYHYRQRKKPVHIPDEYQRHGTGYLLAALNPHTGQVWGRCFSKYNSGTVIWFLGYVLRQLPQEARIIIIWDNASQHGKTVKRWLRKHFGQRVQWLHTPTKAAWLNLIEAWLSMFERDVMNNSHFLSLADFQRATKAYLAYYNAQSHPFRWGRKRRKRLFLVAPLRRTLLSGRACRATLPARFARRLAKVVTS